MAISASEDSPTNRDRIEMKGLLLSFRRLASVEGWRSKRIYRCPSSLRLQTCASPRSSKSQYRARSAATLYQQPRPDSIAIILFLRHGRASLLPQLGTHSYATILFTLLFYSGRYCLVSMAWCNSVKIFHLGFAIFSHPSLLRAVERSSASSV